MKTTRKVIKRKFSWRKTITNLLMLSVALFLIWKFIIMGIARYGTMSLLYYLTEGKLGYVWVYYGAYDNLDFLNSTIVPTLNEIVLNFLSPIVMAIFYLGLPVYIGYVLRGYIDKK